MRQPAPSMGAPERPAGQKPPMPQSAPSMGAPERPAGQKPNAQPPKKGKGLLIAAACVALVVVVGGAFAWLDPLRVMPWSSAPTREAQSVQAVSEANVSSPADNGSSSTQEATNDASSAADGASKSSESSSSDSAGSSSGVATLTEEAPTRISPKESIEVSNLKLAEDALKRYVLTGTAKNIGNETYDVQLLLGATKHKSDRWGEETTEAVSLDVTTITPFTTASGSKLTIFGMGKDESVNFTVYPSHNTVEEFLTDPTCVVDAVSLPDADEVWRYDRDGGIVLDNATDTFISPDGKISIGFTNTTDLYLESVEFRFVAYAKDSDTDPAVYSNYGTRPSGVVVKTEKANMIKPKEKGSVELDLGEQYKKAELLDVKIEPAKDKSTFN